MRAMNRSRKINIIIFIISEYFLMSNWCKEEIRIAQQVGSLTLAGLGGVPGARPPKGPDSFILTYKIFET